MEQNKDNLPVVSVDTVKGAINIALTKIGASFQKLQSLADSLIFDEEHKDSIAQFIVQCKKVEKEIVAAHKEGKAPYKERADAWDDGKNALLAMLTAISTPVNGKFQKLSKEIEDKAIAQAKETLRVKTIQTGIENNVIQFSSQIANCETNEGLLSVERMINLEKSESRKAKYAEFHEDAIKKYDEVLLPILKNQKEKIKQKEAIEKQIKDAEAANDVTKLDELKVKQDRIDNEILQNQVQVQQDALNQGNSFEIATVEEILPEVKTVSRISFEIFDASIAIKKCPELIDVTIKFKDAQKVAMMLKEAGTFNDKSETVVNGIRYFIDKTYKP